MSKNIISIFFAVVFTAFTAAPVVIIVDDSSDVSYFFSISEEEKVSEVKVFLDTDFNDLVDFSFYKKTKNKAYYLKKYSKPHLNIISPPPDFHIV